MTQPSLNFGPVRRIYSVAELSLEIRNLLEKQFPDVWVTGEVSNLRAAGSGHLYFTLKDETAQLRAVCFRNQARYLKFKPQDGLAVIARGRLSVYEARGEYQLYVEFLEPAGLGALQLAFEQLKQKLAAEGLFDPARKKPLPMLPRVIGVVTSPTGAVIRDILRILRRRFRNINVLLYPVKVQGEGAAQEIAQGIEYFNRQAPVDVMIVARGGGSLEDLWAFNEEVVARAIAASKIPVISAVGHETDFTIADFVADLRAPTPSAAAELVVRRKQDLATELHDRARHMAQMIRLKISEARQALTELRMHQVFQTLATRIAERAQRVDECVGCARTVDALAPAHGAAGMAARLGGCGAIRFHAAPSTETRRPGRARAEVSERLPALPHGAAQSLGATGSGVERAQSAHDPGTRLFHHAGRGGESRPRRCAGGDWRGCVRPPRAGRARASSRIEKLSRLYMVTGD